ncbi:hypothetical protein QAD02_023554 [Eretmocerus hayati]|uniref:Uncharacterized protein n=1 Tax=Eretmocerus hayati TaxID=131215 RepID=A0ACC2PVZ1_9HYME|nr:hypothetical protein QAD02_023554 [Eretmocerus hayati]
MGRKKLMGSGPGPISLLCLGLSLGLEQRAKGTRDHHQPNRISTSTINRRSDNLPKRQDKRNLLQLGYGLPQHEVYGPPAPQPPPPPPAPVPVEPDFVHHPQPLPIEHHPVHPQPLPHPQPIHHHPGAPVPIPVNFGPIGFPQPVGQLTLHSN